MFLGAATFEAGRGGIARVARLTAETLLSAGVDIEMRSLIDRERILVAQRLAAKASGNKLLFGAQIRLAAVRKQYFIYDSAGVSRAHPTAGPLNRPYAVWMHGVEVWDRLRPPAARALRGAALCLVNSNFTIDRYRETHGDLPNVQVCRLATADDDAPPPDSKPAFAGPPTTLLLARIDDLTKAKGHAEMIVVWPMVVSAVPGARLLIAGGGPGLDAAKSLAAASPAAALIEVIRHVPEQELPALWRRAHLFAMPSRKEGFGIVYAEAMRYSLPVLASVHDAGPEVNLHGVTGMNVDLDRTNELAETLITLLRSPDLLQQMGQAGHARWREHFRPSAFKRRLLPIIADLVQATA